MSSTHSSRCIEGLRRRAVKHNDDYLAVCADEFERVYQIMQDRYAAVELLDTIKGPLSDALAKAYKFRNGG